jgi:S-adenosylmethionine-dependent methyltransferase
MSERKRVREYYNNHVEDEDKRLDMHPFEIPVTMHFVDRYLHPGQKIFDVACGTGRIAASLMERGFDVGLNDISDKNIELSRQRLSANNHTLFIQRADALHTSGWKKEAWDAVFILGPLYHLLSFKKRLNLLKIACRNLKPGGFVFSSFMTRMGALIYGLKENPEGILYPDGARKLWATGTDDSFVMATEWFTNAYFAHPGEVNELISKAGLEPLHLAGAEGVFGERFELYHKMDNKLKASWMQFTIENCEDPRMVNQAKHLLSISQKPA